MQILFSVVSPCVAPWRPDLTDAGCRITMHRMPEDCAAQRLLAVLGGSRSQQGDAIIRNDFEGPNPDGSYKWAIQTEGGIFHEQRGSFQASKNGPEPQQLVVEGQYQYVAPDGQVINLLYKADENGFQPSGAHLPTPPPVPKAIARALAYLATKPPPTDSDY